MNLSDYCLGNCGTCARNKNRKNQVKCSRQSQKLILLVGWYFFHFFMFICYMVCVFNWICHCWLHFAKNLNVFTFGTAILFQNHSYSLLNNSNIRQIENFIHKCFLVFVRSVYVSLSGTSVTAICVFFKTANKLFPAFTLLLFV